MRSRPASAAASSGNGKTATGACVRPSEKCGLWPSTIMRAEKGSDVALSSAITLAALYGVSLDALLADAGCETCDGMPPAGFICSACGRGALLQRALEDQRPALLAPADLRDRPLDRGTGMATEMSVQRRSDEPGELGDETA